MELLQLKYFCTAAECGSFTATAARFGVPPSAVSQSVKRLEGELGVALFLRRPSRILLSDRGRAFYARASEALALLAEGVTEVGDCEERGRIRICINANRRIVLQAIGRYRRQYPEVELMVEHLAEPDPERYDIIIDDGESLPADIHRRHLVTEQILLAVAADSPYARAGKVKLAELAEEPFVILGENSSLHRLVYSLCRKSGFTPHIALQSDDPFYVRRCVELGLGVTLSPAFSWQGQLSERVACLPLESCERTTYIFTPGGRYTPRCVLRFCDLLVEECRAALAEQ